ncbi:MAG: hypothetical protein NT033_06170 [Candidatus Omnitrophica bacterium]|nr:hypothetical protein [Candidatus Omnitrophota bacterium]
MRPMVVLCAFLISIVGIAIGLFLIRKPGRAIDLQKAFYLGINWRIEPVSISREITSTRIMGVLLVVTCVLAFLACLARVPHVLACISANYR